MAMDLRIALVPRPLKVESAGGVFECDGIPAVNGDSCFAAEIGVFTGQMTERFGPSKADGKADGGPARIMCSKVDDGTIPAEGYQMRISSGQIDLSASDGAGMYHGLQSLRQLFLSGDGGDVFEQNPRTRFAIPCGEITDAPRFPWRGFMLDCSRHFYQVSFIKKLIDILSLHHISRFHWHLTDDQGWRLPVPEYPLLQQISSKRRSPFMQRETFNEGFYTEDDIRSVVAFAAARHIMVVPEVDLPGHTVAALAAYPELGCTGGPYQVEYRFGVFDDILCAGNDRIFDFTGAVFDTLARLFPGPYVHIGGDEAPTARWETCPKCKQRMTEMGFTEARQLQRWLTRRFTLMLTERGKTAIGWDEVLEGVSGNEHTALPDNLIVMYWRSWMDKKIIIDAAAQGRQLIMTPSRHGAYLDYRQIPDPDAPGAGDGSATVEYAYAIPLLYPELSEKQAQQVLGGQGNLWGEWVNSAQNAEYQIFPRICALAEAFWSPGPRDFDDFSRRLAVHRRRIDSLGAMQCRLPPRA
jgi:hexosaminidase